MHRTQFAKQKENRPRFVFECFDLFVSLSSALIGDKYSFQTMNKMDQYSPVLSRAGGFSWETRRSAGQRQTLFFPQFAVASI